MKKASKKMTDAMPMPYMMGMKKKATAKKGMTKKKK